MQVSWRRRLEMEARPGEAKRLGWNNRSEAAHREDGFLTMKALGCPPQTF